MVGDELLLRKRRRRRRRRSAVNEGVVLLPGLPD